MEPNNQYPNQYPPQTPPEPEIPGMITSQPDPELGNTSAQMDSLLNATQGPIGQTGSTGQMTPAPVKAKIKKKTKAPLIITIAVALALLTGGGVFGALMLMNHHKPENVVLGALTKAIGHNAVKLSGEMNIYGEILKDAGISLISIKNEGQSLILPSASETTITIRTTDDEEVEIKTGEVFLADGVLYFRVDGLVDAIDEAMPEELESFVEMFTGVLEEIEGTWWKFDISDFEMPDMVTDMYDCIIGALASLNTDGAKSDLARLYKDYPLLNVERSGAQGNDQKMYDGYNVSLNAANVAGFLNNIRGTDTYMDFAQCMRSVDEDFEDYDDISASDIHLSDDMPTITLYIDTWAHELQFITMTWEGEGILVSGVLNLEFVDSVDISAPEGARPINELYESMMKKMAIQQCEMYGEELLEMMGWTMDECIEVMSPDFDWGEMFDTDGILRGASTERRNELSRFLTVLE